MGIRLASVSCHGGPVNALESGPVGSVLYSGGLDGTIREWRWNAAGSVGDTTPLSSGEGNVSSMAIDARSSCLVSGYSDGRIEIIRLPDGDQVTILEAHADVVSAIVLYPPEQAFLSGSYDGTLVTFGCSSESARSIPTDPYDGPVTSIACGGSGEHVATSAVRSPVILWHAGEWTAKKTLGTDSSTVVSLAFSPDSSHLVTVEYDGELRVYDLESGCLDMRTQVGERGDYPIAVNDAGTRIAVGTDYSVTVFDLHTGRIVDFHPLERAGVYSVTFIPRTDTVAVGCGTGEIIVWDTTTDSTTVSA